MTGPYNVEVHFIIVIIIMAIAKVKKSILSSSSSIGIVIIIVNIAKVQKSILSSSSSSSISSSSS